MRVKLTDLIDALNNIKYDHSYFDNEDVNKTVIDISVVEESIKDAMYTSALTLTATTVIPEKEGSPERTIKRTVELYEVESGMRGQFTKSTTQALRSS